MDFSLISLTAMTAEADFRSCPRFRPHALWLGIGQARMAYVLAAARAGCAGLLGRRTLAYVLATWEGLRQGQEGQDQKRQKIATFAQGERRAYGNTCLGKGRLSLLRT